MTKDELNGAINRTAARLGLESLTGKIKDIDIPTYLSILSSHIFIRQLSEDPDIQLIREQLKNLYFDTGELVFEK